MRTTGTHEDKLKPVTSFHCLQAHGCRRPAEAGALGHRAECTPGPVLKITNGGDSVERGAVGLGAAMGQQCEPADQCQKVGTATMPGILLCPSQCKGSYFTSASQILRTGRESGATLAKWTQYKTTTSMHSWYGKSLWLWQEEPNHELCLLETQHSSLQQMFTDSTKLSPHPSLEQMLRVCSGNLGNSPVFF